MRSDADLERLVDDELTRLPAPRAPHTLRPRVLAAVAAAARDRQKTHARPWFAWPRSWQAAFVAALVLVAAGGGWLASSGIAAAGWSWPDWSAAPMTRVVDAGRDLQALLEGVRIFFGAIFMQPVVWCLIALVIVMTTACATFGAMLGRMANFEVQGAD